MTRYIDADALDLMHIDQTDLPQNGCLSVVLFEDVCNAPTADVVEVVRCENCKHRNEKSHMCNKLYRVMIDGEYCSYGERRE